MRVVPLVLLVATAACNMYFGGDDGGADDDGDDAPPVVIDGELVAATTLFTDVLAFAVDGDATLVVALRDEGTDDARLVSIDVRDHEVVELDRAPIGVGRPQVLVGRSAIVWGFGGTLSTPGTFRLVRDGLANALAFGERAPSVVLGQHYDYLTYASTRDCSIETLDLSTAVTEVRGSVSCFAELAAVVLDAGLGIWLRVDEASGTSIGMMDGLWVGPMSFAKSAMEHAVGPFVGPGSYWFVENSGGQARVQTGSTGQWPVPTPVEFAAAQATVNAAALVGTDVWGGSQGTTSYLFPIEPGGLTIRYAVPYQPDRLVGLADRLIVLLADGMLLEQPLDEN